MHYSLLIINWNPLSPSSPFPLNGGRAGVRGLPSPPLGEVGRGPISSPAPYLSNVSLLKKKLLLSGHPRFLQY